LFVLWSLCALCGLAPAADNGGAVRTSVGTVTGLGSARLRHAWRFWSEWLTEFNRRFDVVPGALPLACVLLLCQTPVPTGTPCYALPGPGNQLYVALRETGLLTFKQPLPERIISFQPTAGEIVGHIVVNSELLLLDNEVGPLLFDAGRLSEPLVWIYGGRRLAPAGDRNAFLVVCEHSVIGVALEGSKGRVLYTLPAAMIGLGQPLAGAAATEGGLVLADTSGQVVLTMANAQENRLTWQQTAQQNVGAQTSALVPLNRRLGLLATKRGLLGYRISPANGGLSIVRLRPGAVDAVHVSDLLVVWHEAGQWRAASRELVERAIQNSRLLDDANCGPLANIKRTDSVALLGRRLTAWSEKERRVTVLRIDGSRAEPTGTLRLFAPQGLYAGLPNGAVLGVDGGLLVQRSGKWQRYSLPSEPRVLGIEGGSAWVVHQSGVLKLDLDTGHVSARSDWRDEAPTAAAQVGNHLVVAGPRRIRCYSPMLDRQAEQPVPTHSSAMALGAVNEQTVAVLLRFRTGNQGGGKAKPQPPEDSEWGIATYAVPSLEPGNVLRIAGKGPRERGPAQVRKFGRWGKNWWAIDGDGTVWLVDESRTWRRFDGGVRDAAAQNGELFLAKGRYGVRVVTLSGSVPEYSGGWSARWMAPQRINLTGNHVYAYQPGAIYEIRPHRLAQTAEFPVPGLRGMIGPIRLYDNGVDVTSVQYAVDRGYTEPLRLVEHSGGEPGPVSNGTVLIDRERGTVRFSAGSSRVDVTEIGSCFLPHPGNTFAVYRGRYLFVGGGEGRNLECWDLADPARPSHLWRLQPAVGPPVAMSVQDETLLVSVNIWGVGLYLYDLSDIRKPRLIGSCQKLGDRISGLHVQGHYAYVVSYRPDPAVLVVDWSKKAKPHLAAKLSVPGAYALAGSGEQLFVLANVGGKAELVVIDARGTTLSVRARYPLNFQAGSVSATDRFVAVGGSVKENGKSYGALALFRRKPDGALDPIAVRRLEPTGWRTETRVCVTDAALYVGHMSPSDTVLRTLDLRQGQLPVASELHVGPGLDAACTIGEMLRHGNWLLVAVPERGLRIYDLTRPLQPQFVYAVPAAEGWGGHVEVAGNVAYIDDEGGPHFAITTVDVSDPAHPRLVARTLPPGTVRPCHPLFLSNRLLVLSNGGPMAALSVEDRFRPTFLGALSAGGSGPAAARGVVPFREHLALVAPLYWNGQWALVDVSDARQPRIVARVTGRRGGGHGTVGIAAWRNYVFWFGMPGARYDGNRANGFRAYDLSDPAAPKELGSWFLYNVASNGEVAQRDGFLFFWIDRVGIWGSAGWWAGRKSNGRLLVFDVRDPHTPKLVADYPAPAMTGVLADMTIHGSFLYLVSYMEWRLMVLDVTDPTAPVEVTNWARPGDEFWYPGGIDIAGDYGYVTGADRLSVLRLPLAPQLPAGKLAVRPAR